MLRIENLAFHYPDAAFYFDLTVRRGEILSVIGPSGSGKSTLVQLVGGFLEPAAGRIRVNGDDITGIAPENRPLTTVFQEHNLFPHLTLFDNVALGISPNLKLDRDARGRVTEALERVHLGAFAARRPAELSGGQRQRATLARVLVRQRPVLLLDEPLTALGPALRRELLELIRELVQRERMAAILVSHHPADARAASARTAFLADGRIHALADTDVLLANREDAVVADYLGRPD